MLSHDDESPAMRQAFRAQGVAIAEFPVNEETARDAAAAGDFIVFGAPNVVRGGSHTGWTKASDMIAKGLCSVLASDYYYPAPLLAAFRLAADGVLPLAQAWQLISSAPARAAGLTDRGVLAAGQRADIILVDDTMPLRPRIVAVIAAGRLVHLTEANRLVRSSVTPAQGGCGRVRRPLFWRDGKLSPLRDLLRRSARQRARPVRRALLGYDAFGGDDLPFPDGVLRASDWRDLTQDPRKYGFHATLKAPFSLADGKTEAELVAACALFAATARPVPVIRPVVGSISGFIAVIPAEPSAELELLAADCVQAHSIRSARRSARKIARGEIPQTDAAAARPSRPLGLSLRVRGVSLPHDADRTASRRTARARSGDAARSVCGNRPRDRSRSTRLPSAVRKIRIRGFASSAAGNCRNDGPACQTQNIENNPMQSRIGARNGPI